MFILVHQKNGVYIQTNYTTYETIESTKDDIKLLAYLNNISQEDIKVIHKCFLTCLGEL